MKALLVIFLLALLCATGCLDHDEDMQLADPKYESIICKHGHQYFMVQATAPYVGFLAIAPIFDEDGHPKGCEAVNQ